MRWPRDWRSVVCYSDLDCAPGEDDDEGEGDEGEGDEGEGDEGDDDDADDGAEDPGDNEDGDNEEIGRASCREAELSSQVAGSRSQNYEAGGTVGVRVAK